MTLFRVQYAPTEGAEWVEVQQEASTPIEAARLVIGEDLVRGGMGRKLTFVQRFIRAMATDRTPWFGSIIRQ